MKSANKKFGNIGDIEVISCSEAETEIIEAWDAKYAKPYLYDELGELEDKLPSHKAISQAGFVCNTEPIIRDDINEKLARKV